VSERTSQWRTSIRSAIGGRCANPSSAAEPRSPDARRPRRRSHRRPGSPTTRGRRQAQPSLSCDFPSARSSRPHAPPTKAKSALSAADGAPSAPRSAPPAQPAPIARFHANGRDHGHLRPSRRESGRSRPPFGPPGIRHSALQSHFCEALLWMLLPAGPPRRICSRAGIQTGPYRRELRPVAPSRRKVEGGGLSGRVGQTTSTGGVFA
jgi:hypothetical protein